MSDRRPIRIDSSWVVFVCATMIVSLAGAHLVFQWLRFERGLDEVYGFVRMFDLAAEANLPSFFSSAQIVACAVIAVLIGIARRSVADRFAMHWIALGAILFALGLDEAAEIHELTIRPMRELFPSVTTGLLFWGWVVPAGLLVTLVGVSYLRFVFVYLPAATRNACVIGAVLFVGGAIGVEMPEARHFQLHGDRNLGYAMFVLVEEVLEMLGMLVLLRGLLRHLATEVGPIALQVVQTECEAASTRAPGRPASRREPRIRSGFDGAPGPLLPARYVENETGRTEGPARARPAMSMHAEVRNPVR